MNLDDWSNDHAEKDRQKGIRNTLRLMHKKALVKRCPDNTDSSKSIQTLVKIVSKTMSKAAKKFNSCEQGKLLKTSEDKLQAGYLLRVNFSNAES